VRAIGLLWLFFYFLPALSFDIFQFVFFIIVSVSLYILTELLFKQNRIEVCVDACTYFYFCIMHYVSRNKPNILLQV